MLRCRIILTVILSAFSFAGCNDNGLDGLVPVSGSVNYKGLPVDGADVVFNPEFAGRAASAKTDAHGKYQLTTLNPQDGAQPGNYKVSISKKQVIDPMSAEEAEEWFHKHSGPPPSRKLKNDLPDKFSDDKTSGLKAEVKQDEKNEIAFELK